MLILVEQIIKKTYFNSKLNISMWKHIAIREKIKNRGFYNVK